MCVRPMKKEALAGWAVGVGSVEHRGEHAVVCEYATFFFSPFPIGPETPEQGKTKRGLPEWVSSPPIHPCTGIKTQRHRHQAIVATAAAAAAAAAARIGEGERKKHTDSSSCCDDCLTDAGVATASLTSALADCLDVCLRDVAD